jgi:hypothetical protein
MQVNFNTSQLRMSLQRYASLCKSQKNETVGSDSKIQTSIPQVCETKRCPPAKH